MSDPHPPNPGKTPSCSPTCCGGRSWVLWALAIALVAAYSYSNRTPAPSGPSAVPWTEDLPAALTKAAQTHQPILLDFHATWCGPCKAMAAEVFTRKDVAHALDKWIAVSIDGDKQPSVVNNYKVEAYPTFVALDSTGKEVFRYEGSMSAEEFIRQIQAVGKAIGAGHAPRRVNQAETAGELDALRLCVPRERPFGGPARKNWTPHQLGLENTLRS